MTHRHVLRGCRPEPFGSYLQGLGVLRLVGQQVDADATGYWTDSGFVLNTALDEEELLLFFLEAYAPTPMVAPWNKGAGYRGDGKSKNAEDLVLGAEGSTHARLAPWREAIRVARGVSDRYVDDKSFTASKELIVSESRALLPDEALEWLDSAIALTEGGPVYPHVLGTGGNLGRLDLSANMLTHLDAVIGLRAVADVERSRSWLRDALHRGADAAYVKAAAGQYDPGRAGGLNTSVLDEGDAMINPWGFILQLEGTLLFASGLAKRLGSAGDNVAAMPFTVRPTAAGSGHLTDDEPSKGELWLPLWSSPSTLAETRRLFSEARLRWGSRPARDGIDAARAVATLGTDRGIPAFSRTAIVERLGQSPLAVSAGRVKTGHRTEVGLTSQLDPWLMRVRRVGHSIRSIANGVRRIDEALMAVTTTSDGGAAALQDVLHAAADIDRRISRNARLRGDVGPLQPLNTNDWLPALDDGTAEFAMAWGFASLHEQWGDPRRKDEEAYRWCSSLRNYLRGTIRPSARHRLGWSGGPRLSFNLDQGPVGALASIHAAHAARGIRLEGVPDHRTTMRQGAWIDPGIVEAFAAGRLDERRIASLLRSLVLLDVDNASAGLVAAERPCPAAVAPTWRLLAPLFPTGREATITVQREGMHAEVLLGASREWPTMLTRNAHHAVLRAALTRYRTRIGQIRQVPIDDLVRGLDGNRLAAALLPAISPSAARTLLENVALPATQQVHD